MTVVLSCDKCGFEMEFNEHQRTITQYGGSVHIACPYCGKTLAILTVEVKASVSIEFYEEEKYNHGIRGLDALFH